MKITQGKNKIRYLGNTFKEWFGDMEVETGKHKELYSKQLSRRMNDKEILAELKPTEVSLGEMLKTLDTMDKSWWSIFYVKDKDGLLRTVNVYWYDGGWYVRASSVVSPDGWRGGHRVFSRNPFDTETPSASPSDPLDTLSLDSAIKLVKENGYKVIKEF